MAPIIAAGIVRISLSGTYAGNTWANVFHVTRLGGSTAEEAATSAAQAWQDQILPALDGNVNLTSANYVDLGTSLGVSGPIPDLTLPDAGGAPGEGEPPNVAYLLHLQALGTRKQRSGRMYLTGVPGGSALQDGSIDGTARTGLQTRVDDWVDQIGDDAVAGLVVLSKATGGDYEGRTVTGVTVDARAATQRRRLRR